MNPSSSSKFALAVMVPAVIAIWSLGGFAVAGASASPDSSTLPRESNWVPLSEAFVSGTLQEHRLGEFEKRQARSWLGQAPARETEESSRLSGSEDDDECDVLIVTSSQEPGASLEKTLESTSVSVIGQVTEMTPGLHHGRLASLVTVKVDRWIDRTPGLPVTDTIYFIYPEARASIAGTTYCSRGQRPERLAPGRHVFVGASSASSHDLLVLYPLTRDVFFEGPRHEVSAEGTEDGLQNLTWQEFDALVEQRASSKRVER